MKDLEHIKSLPILAIKDRKIRQDTASTYRVRASVSQEDGTTITHLYSPDTLGGKLVGYECKDTANKAFTSIGDRKGELDLWGSWTCTGGNKLFVTEGRLDAMALHQTINDNNGEKYKDFKASVVSLTRGASGAVKDLLNNKALFSKYKEVVLVFDNDEAGKKATKECLKLFPLYKTAKLSMKDPCDMLVHGKQRELYESCVFNASVERQGEVVDVSDIIENAMLKPEMGISFPWPTVTKACFGLRPHTCHVVGAAPKVGKTDHQHQLVHHLVYNEKVKVGMFDLENSPVKTAKKLASKQAKKDFTRPDTIYTDHELRSTLESLDGKVRFYDRSGSRDWEDIRTAITEMHLLDGINIFIIDPITALISRFSSSEANDELNRICTDVSDLCSLYPITLFFYSHVNPKPKTSTPHEKGARVYSSELSGSRAMEKWFHYGHGISRDRSDECPEERKNMSEFYMLFDRDFGQSYTCDVYFDEQTVTYLEPTNRWK
jgi:twinkle protein